MHEVQETSGPGAVDITLVDITLTSWQRAYVRRTAPPAQVDEAQTAEILERKLKVRAGSLLYIQSTVPLKKMQKLCSKYKCFNRDSVWKERSEEVRIPISLVLLQVLLVPNHPL